MNPAKPAEFFTAASHLRNLADATQGLLTDRSLLVAPGSAAATDCEDVQYDGAWGLGTQMVCLEVVPRLLSVTDHVRGLAALCAAPGVSIALAALVRPTLDALATLSWLYDPALDTRERVRRRFNLRLVSLAQEENLAGLSGRTAAGFEETIDTFAAEARRHGFRFVAPKTSNRGIVHPGYLNAPVPSDEALITLLMPPGIDGQDLGAFIYRRTSAVVHGQIHGLHPFFVSQAPGPQPGLARVELGLPFAWFCILTISVIAPLNATMKRLFDHYGWDPTEWDVASRSAIEQWTEWLTAVRDSASTESAGSDPANSGLA